MFSIPLGTTRAVLLIESRDPDGNVSVMAHDLRLLSTRYEVDYNVFNGGYGRVDIEAIHMGDRIWEGSIPSDEIASDQLAISSSESEIVIDEEGFEEW